MPAVRIAAGKALGQAVDTPSKAYAELLLGLALALNKMKDKTLPISLAHIARYANPDNNAGTLLLGLLLDAGDRQPDALAMLRTIRPGTAFAAQAQDAEVRILNGMDNHVEALDRARAFVAAAPTADSYSRLGAALIESERFGEAADAYGQAIALVDRRHRIGRGLGTAPVPRQRARIRQSLARSEGRAGNRHEAVARQSPAAQFPRLRPA